MEEARPTRGGSSRSISRPSSRPSSNFGRGGSTTTHTVTRTRVVGTYRPYGGHVLVIGTPYYDAHYGYYYDVHGNTYRGGG